MTYVPVKTSVYVPPRTVLRMVAWPYNIRRLHQPEEDCYLLRMSFAAPSSRYNWDRSFSLEIQYADQPSMHGPTFSVVSAEWYDMGYGGYRYALIEGMAWASPENPCTIENLRFWMADNKNKPLLSVTKLRRL